MPDLFLDPRLDDYFVERDWATIARDDAARDQAIDDFKRERIAVLSGVDRSAIDFAFHETVRFPQTWGMKKFQFKTLIADVAAGRETALVAQVLADSFAGDRVRFHRFVDQLVVIDDLARRVVGRILGGLEVETLIMVARFSETRMENLHYDLDADSDTHEAFRFYINLDAYPRMWSTSYRITSLIEQGGQRLTAGLDPALPAETIAKRVVSRAFGGWNHRACERIAPRHQVYFDPGDVWIVDGRSVSHQVLTGNRVLSVYARLPHDRNPSLAPGFGARVRAAMTRAADVAPGEETAIVNYFRPEQIGPGVDLRGDWETVFGRTGTGHLRRFDDLGLVKPSDAATVTA